MGAVCSQTAEFVALLFAYRGVDTFEDLCSLLVADELKSNLYGGPLNYVLSLEGEEWFAPEKVATLSDIYINSRSDHEVERARVTTATTPTGSRPVHKHNAEGYRSGHNTHKTSPARRCYDCKALGHLSLIHI